MNLCRLDHLKVADKELLHHRIRNILTLSHLLDGVHQKLLQNFDLYYLFKFETVFSSDFYLKKIYCYIFLLFLTYVFENKRLYT
ncbi:hypothetical protein BpHYR1_024885 [Brachionus plicatilis]|uniref:Uncharacterized protein n=1 Tax=Brachionus plicatilis TaxID=10195 RepID=A0A3M7PFZ9_BRAPC|nr:hypothetical protein BpHYR1_024885 [Brachionus plicatilis]